MRKGDGSVAQPATAAAPSAAAPSPVVRPAPTAASAAVAALASHPYYAEAYAAEARLIDSLPQLRCCDLVGAEDDSCANLLLIKTRTGKTFQICNVCDMPIQPCEVQYVCGPHCTFAHAECGKGVARALANQLSE